MYNDRLLQLRLRGIGAAYSGSLSRFKNYVVEGGRRIKVQDPESVHAVDEAVVTQLPVERDRAGATIHVGAPA